MQLASDDVLLAGIAVGDEQAMSVFARRYQPRVFGLARSIVGDTGVAEDVAQEAFIRAWRHADAYDPRRGSVPAWLLTITRNLALDTLRLRKPEPVDPDMVRHAEVEAMGPGSSPDTSAVLDDEVGRLRAALAELPPPQRRALVMASIFGRTAQEISDIEGIPLGTAKTRIRAGMLRLRQRLAGEAMRA